MEIKKAILILQILFLIPMIPNIIVYGYHAHHEYVESEEHIGDSTMDHKGHEQFAEFVLFTGITIGYIITTILVFTRPFNYASYCFILIGTVSIIIIYYASKTIGFPAPDFYDWYIIDDTTNWKDNVTKIAQQIFVIPLAMILTLRLIQDRKIKIN